MTERDEGDIRLLSLAVHEFRTPLNVAAGYLKMLADRRSGPLSDRQALLVSRTTESLDALTGLVADLSEIARLDAGELNVARRRHDPAALAASVVDAFAASRDTPCAVLDVQPGTYAADLDVERLARALRACLDAVAREAPGGTVSVSVSSPDPNTVAIVVAPTGRLPALVASDAWGAADEWRGGLGLELALARRVVEGHGGRLRSPTAAGDRPAFMVALPLAGGAAPSPSAGAGLARGPRRVTPGP